MQGVHTAVLPNGKVLIANGSSNRNTLENGKFIDGNNSRDYDTVNNTSLFNPVTNTFERIDSPPAELFNQSNDVFCSGHLHLANGNVLFVSGTNRYYPGEQFEGSKQTNIYNWKENKWTTVGQLKEGRWYPSLVSLADGKIVIFSGLKFGKPGQITPTIEIYDPKTDKLHYIDLGYIEDSPFNVKINQYKYRKAQGDQFVEVTEKADVYDSIDIYPRVFPTPDGRLLITGDGAGKFPLELHQSNKTYLMSVIEKSDGSLDVSFEVGPDRKDVSKVYGTGLLDPNAEGDVLLIGGLVNTNNIGYGWPQFPSANKALEAKGVRIATSLERWSSPKNSGEPNGEWKIVDKFLQHPRAMNLAVILPTKEVLTINGGEYPEYKAIFEPLLMTPDKFSPGGYKTKLMSSAKLPRLYHNGALLLPDARVLSIGGNPYRAARKKDGTVHVDVLPSSKNYYEIAQLQDKSGNPQQFDAKTYYNSPQHYFAKIETEEGVKVDPEPFVPAEILQAEIFSPPYLFKAGPRPEITTTPATLKYGQSGTISVKDASQDGSLVLVKLGTVTHAFDYGQRLADLQIDNVELGAPSSVTFKAPDNPNLYPPGYYMMFYVNDIGKPSVAKIVKLEA
ncbi:MAG: DUF1929 domain-containing protein [Symploca sp. SIO1B1]|nr:DUF1929 domain-containing protein [Symploca sp. SIO1C2]NER92512.1 DUF1929 domain-containing protein [Symploca sp. SIO1B1]